jgi:hypothetical protein
MSAFDDTIEAALDAIDGDFVAAILADKLVANAEATELNEWLHEHAVAFVTARIKERCASRRSSALRRAPARRFGKAAAAAESGDLEPISHFRVVYVVDDTDTRRSVGDMTGADHTFVASRYEQRGNRQLMLGAFHRSVAKKVGKRRTADVFTEEQYDALLRSITGAAA